MNHIHHSIERSANIEYPRHFVELNKQHPRDNSKISPILSLYITAPLSDHNNDKITLYWENKESFKSVKNKAESFLNDNFNEWIDQFGDYSFKLSHSRINGFPYEYMIKDNHDLSLTLNNIQSFLKGEKKLETLYLSDYLDIPDLEDFGKPQLKIYRTAKEPIFGEIRFCYGLDDLTYYHPMRPKERNQLLADELIKEMTEYLLGEARVVSKSFRTSPQYPIRSVSVQTHQEGFEKTFIFNFQIGE